MFCTHASSVSIVMWTELVSFSLFFFFFFKCCFTSTEATRDVRDGEPRTSTSTFTQLRGIDIFGLPASTFKRHACLTHHPKQYYSVFGREMSPHGCLNSSSYSVWKPARPTVVSCFLFCLFLFKKRDCRVCYTVSCHCNFLLDIAKQ